jgi:hypothetical protein
MGAGRACVSGEVFFANELAGVTKASPKIMLELDA